MVLRAALELVAAYGPLSFMTCNWKAFINQFPQPRCSLLAVEPADRHVQRQSFPRIRDLLQSPLPARHHRGSGPGILDGYLACQRR